MGNGNVVPGLEKSIEDSLPKQIGLARESFNYHLAAKWIKRTVDLLGVEDTYNTIKWSSGLVDKHKLGAVSDLIEVADWLVGIRTYSVYKRDSNSQPNTLLVCDCSPKTGDSALRGIHYEACQFDRENKLTRMAVIALDDGEVRGRITLSTDSLAVKHMRLRYIFDYKEGSGEPVTNLEGILALFPSGEVREFLQRIEYANFTGEIFGLITGKQPALA